MAVVLVNHQIAGAHLPRQHVRIGPVVGDFQSGIGVAQVPRNWLDLLASPTSWSLDDQLPMPVQLKDLAL